MKTILFATDFSENSVQALNYAYALKEKLNARLVTTHIGDTHEIINHSFASKKNSFKEMKQEYKIFSMYKLMEYVSNNLNTTDTLSNTFFEIKNDISPDIGINEVARAYKADLILTGLNGSNDTFNKKRYLGNNVKNLVNKAQCPVLAIPTSNSNAFSIKNIVYISNFEMEELIAIKKILALAKLLNAHVTILHVSPENDTTLKNKKLALKMKIENENSYSSWSIKSIIANSALEGLNYIMHNEMVDILSFFENRPNQWVDKFYHKDLVKSSMNFPALGLLALNKKQAKNQSSFLPDYADFKFFHYASM